MRVVLLYLSFFFFFGSDCSLVCFLMTCIPICHHLFFTSAVTFCLSVNNLRQLQVFPLSFSRNEGMSTDTIQSFKQLINVRIWRQIRYMLLKIRRTAEVSISIVTFCNWRMTRFFFPLFSHPNNSLPKNFTRDLFHHLCKNSTGIVCMGFCRFALSAWLSSLFSTI